MTAIPAQLVLRAAVDALTTTELAATVLSLDLPDEKLVQLLLVCDACDARTATDDDDKPACLRALVKVILTSWQSRLFDEGATVRLLKCFSKCLERKEISVALDATMGELLSEQMDILKAPSAGVKQVGVIFLQRLLVLSEAELKVVRLGFGAEFRAAGTAGSHDDADARDRFFSGSENAARVENGVRASAADFEDVEQAAFWYASTLSRAIDALPSPSGSGRVESSDIGKELRRRLGTGGSAPKTPSPVAAVPAGASERKSSESSLIGTPTTMDNLARILDAVDCAAPLLIEGATGVGKSATIQEAANITGNQLVRFNMSSRVDIEDLFGKVLMQKNERGDDDFVFVEQPFTIAFSKGYWLLLDELNLAADTVLQALEVVLDTGVIRLADSSDAGASTKVYSRAAGFRLFATQNPGSGFFKGMRQALSDSFLSRFRPCNFSDLPSAEWAQIIAEKLVAKQPRRSGAKPGKSVDSAPLSPVQAAEYAKIMVKVHDDYRGIVREASFKEQCAYSEVSIRDLLRFVGQVRITMEGEADTSNIHQVVAREAWSVYGARFRRQESREAIRRIPYLRSLLADDVTAESWNWSTGVSSFVREFVTGGVRDDDAEKEALAVSVRDAIKIPESASLDSELWTSTVFSACGAHLRIRAALWTADVVQRHGLYRVDATWLQTWLKTVAASIVRGDPPTPKAIALVGAATYVAFLRHGKSLTETVLRAVNAHYRVAISPDECERAVIALSDSVAPDCPFVVTLRVRQLWKELLHTLRQQQPTVVVGRVGCGKSDAVVALACLLGIDVSQVCITPETEPTELVGQQGPTSGGDRSRAARVSWRDGHVTGALRRGNWLLLDNFGDGDACTLERLNPLLEQPPVWVLAEDAQVDSLPVPPDFRVLATMSTSAGVGDRARDLSPALYNRFVVTVMNDIASTEADKTSFVGEMQPLVEALLTEPPAGAAAAAAYRAEVATVVDICWLLRRHEKVQLSFRGIVRLVNALYAFQRERTVRFDTFEKAFSAAINVAVLSQLKTDAVALLKTLLGSLHIDVVNMGLPGSIPAKNGGSEEYVLTVGRSGIANAVCASSVVCGLPCLLEGPAAVGKTALIAALGTWKNTGQADDFVLKRVNNTDTTTVQDYWGTFVPRQNGFVFQEGKLYEAVKNGWWFLADEFNL